MAVRLLRQSMAPVLVLRLARSIAHLFAFHWLLLLRALALRHVLWPRLARDGAADGQTRQRALRPRACQCRVRMGLYRTSTRGGSCGIRRRCKPEHARKLSTRILRVGRSVSWRGRACDPDLQA